MTEDQLARCERAANLIDQADALVVAAGAGMGVDSGLPDFRGPEGFWRAYPALRRRGLRFEQIADPDRFAADPVLAWGFYGHRLAMYRRMVPHAGFEILRRWGQTMPHGMFVFTSNVDGQFQRAGFDAQRIVECHGSIHHLQCATPCCAAIWPADDFVPDVDDAECLLRNAAPICPHCGAIARPNVLMFGDFAWRESRAAGQEVRLEQWLERVERPVVVEVGAGTAIPSVRRFSERMIVEYGGRLVRINLREPDVALGRDVGIAAGAAAALQAIDALLV